MSDQQSEGVEPADVAKRLSRTWQGAADRAAALGIGEQEIGVSMVGAGLARWLNAVPAEDVATALRALADQVEGPRPEPGRVN